MLFKRTNLCSPLCYILTLIYVYTPIQIVYLTQQHKNCLAHIFFFHWFAPSIFSQNSCFHTSYSSLSSYVSSSSTTIPQSVLHVFITLLSPVQPLPCLLSQFTTYHSPLPNSPCRSLVTMLMCTYQSHHNLQSLFVFTLAMIHSSTLVCIHSCACPILHIYIFFP